MGNEENKDLKLQRKGIARFRISVLLVILSLAILGYIIYQIITIINR